MENERNETEKDEIINPEQFQVGRASEDEKINESDETNSGEDELAFIDESELELDEDDDDEQGDTETSADAEYTEGESEFADGEGTQLAAAFDEPTEDEELDEDDETS